MGKVHPSAWERMGYEDAVRGLSCWPLAIPDDADAHEKECAAAYLSGYARGHNPPGNQGGSHEKG